MTAPLEALLAQGAADGVFPLARAVVLHRGAEVFSGGNTPEGTHFDLASVTKVFSTTALTFEALRAGALTLDTRVDSVLPTALGGVTVEDLLFHRSGLPAFAPYFAAVLREYPSLHAEQVSPRTRARARDALFAAVAATPLEAAPRTRAVYSDVGFILLGELLARLAGAPLDALFAERIATPYALEAGYRRLSGDLPLPAHLAATGATRPREPAPGQEGLWSADERPGLAGEVDDDNAWALDGVSGHAGLFGTARAVARFGQRVLEGAFAPPAGFRTDPLVTGSTRTLGFDTPGDNAPSCGARFGRAGPRGAVGHLGFTGTSLWIDFDRQLVVALLTNRVALGRANVAIRTFRPGFHEAVLDALGG